MDSLKKQFDKDRSRSVDSPDKYSGRLSSRRMTTEKKSTNLDVFPQQPGLPISNELMTFNHNAYLDIPKDLSQQGCISRNGGQQLQSSGKSQRSKS